MPKDRRVNSSSSDWAMVSPCSSKISDRNNCDGSSPHVGDEREWEEARCPICLEHPHNAVLLLCSSREKGCRPFICDTSYRHSNCLDQFRKSAAALSLETFIEQQQSELVCPLCRGLITGWDVIHPARSFMNTKIRSCSLETCSFTGSYVDLRKHARLEHPSERPSVASPTRQSNWMVLEQQREIEDALAHQSDFEYDMDEWPDLDGLPSWEEWSDDAFWGDRSFFDFPSGMSDFEDELIDEIFSELSFSFFSLYSSALEEEMMDSGSSRNSDRPQRAIITTNSGSRSNNQVGNAVPSSRSRSGYRRENGATISRSRSGYGTQNGPTVSRSRSRYHRENDGTNVRARSRSYPRENGSTGSSRRPSYRRENAATSPRTGWRYPRENGPANSRPRSSYQMENNAPTSSRTRSSYHRENVQPRSSARSRYYRREDAPPPPGRRSDATRHLPGSSRRPQPDFEE